MAQYKVWLHIEKVNEKKDVYEDQGLPVQLGEFKSLNKASVLADKVKAISDIIQDDNFCQ